MTSRINFLGGGIKASEMFWKCAMAVFCQAYLTLFSGWNALLGHWELRWAALTLQTGSHHEDTHPSLPVLLLNSCIRCSGREMMHFKTDQFFWLFLVASGQGCTGSLALAKLGDSPGDIWESPLLCNASCSKKRIGNKG